MYKAISCPFLPIPTLVLCYIFFPVYVLNYFVIRFSSFCMLILFTLFLSFNSLIMIQQFQFFHSEKNIQNSTGIFVANDFYHSYLFCTYTRGERTTLLHIGGTLSITGGVNSCFSPNSSFLFSSILVEGLQYVMRIETGWPVVLSGVR